MTRTVTVLDWKAGSFTHINAPLQDHIDNLQVILLGIPQEYRDSAMIEIDVDQYMYSESWRPSVSITYQRPETPAETREREKGEAARRAVQEKNERAVYERLSAKFNPPKGG